VTTAVRSQQNQIRPEVKYKRADVTFSVIVVSKAKDKLTRATKLRPWGPHDPPYRQVSVISLMRCPLV